MKATLKRIKYVYGFTVFVCLIVMLNVKALSIIFRLTLFPMLMLDRDLISIIIRVIFLLRGIALICFK